MDSSVSVCGQPSSAQAAPHILVFPGARVVVIPFRPFLRPFRGCRTPNSNLDSNSNSVHLLDPSSWAGWLPRSHRHPEPSPDPGKPRHAESFTLPISEEQKIVDESCPPGPRPTYPAVNRNRRPHHITPTRMSRAHFRRSSQCLSSGPRFSCDFPRSRWISWQVFSNRAGHPSAWGTPSSCIRGNRPRADTASG